MMLRSSGVTSRQMKVPIAILGLWILLALRVGHRSLLGIYNKKHAAFEGISQVYTIERSAPQSEQAPNNATTQDPLPSLYSHLQPHLNKLLSDIDHRTNQSSEEKYRCLRNVRSAKNTTPPTNVILYSNERKDRSGATIQDMLMAHAYAYHHNATYGGACFGGGGSYSGLGESMDAPNNNDALRHLDAHKHLLRSIGLGDELPFQCPQKGTNRRNCDTLHIKVKPSVYKSDSNIYWTAEWREHIQAQVRKTAPKPAVAEAEKRPFTIVVHIRRGDVDPCTHYQRYLPNAHYVALIEEAILSTIKMTTPKRNGSELEKDKNIDYNKYRVVVFSETPSFEPLDAFNSSSVSLPGNRSIDYDLHLNGDIAFVWSTMINDADVIITSKSSFSYVAAVLATAIRETSPSTNIEAVSDGMERSNTIVGHGGMKRQIHGRRKHLFSNAPRVLYTQYSSNIPMDGWEVITKTSEYDKEVRRLRSQYCHRRSLSEFFN